MSPGDFSDDHRRNTAARFARALHRNFTGPKQVADAWGVDRSTAENWWNGNNQPLLWVAAKAMDTPSLRPVLRDMERA